MKLPNRIRRRPRHGWWEYGLGEGHNGGPVGLLHPHQDLWATLELGHDGTATWMKLHVLFRNALEKI